MLGIVVMSLMVADLDKPFHGFMVVRLDSVVDVIRLLDHTCLRHSKSMMGIGKSSILASVELPPEDAPPDEESPRDVVKGGRAVSFRSRSYMDNFKKQPPSMVYRTASGRFSPKEQQGILAMARLRTASAKAKSTDISNSGGPVSPGGTGALGKVEEVTVYDDLDEMEASVLGRPGSQLPH